MNPAFKFHFQQSPTTAVSQTQTPPYSGESSRPGPSQAVLMVPTMEDAWPSNPRLVSENYDNYFNYKSETPFTTDYDYLPDYGAGLLESSSHTLQAATEELYSHYLKPQISGVPEIQHQVTKTLMAERIIQEAYKNGSNSETIAEDFLPANDTARTCLDSQLDGNQKLVRLEDIRRDIDYDHFRVSTHDDYQGLGGENTSPRSIPPGYTSFPFAFERSCYKLRGNEPITLHNLVQGLESYHKRCEIWTQNLAGFIKQVENLVEFAEPPQPAGQSYISFAQNAEFFFFEIITPIAPGIAERISEVVARADSPRVLNVGIFPDQASQPGYLDNITRPLSPQYVVPFGNQEFDEDGTETSPRLLGSDEIGFEEQSPTPVPGLQAQSRARSRGSSRRKASQIARGNDRSQVSSPSRQASRKRLGLKKKAAPSTPLDSTSGKHSGTSEPPTTILKTPRKRTRKIKQEPTTFIAASRIASHSEVKLEAHDEASRDGLTSSPDFGMGLGIRQITTAANLDIVPVYDKGVHPRYGSTYPTGYAPELQLSSPSGASESTQTLSDEEY